MGEFPTQGQPNPEAAIEGAESGAPESIPSLVELYEAADTAGKDRMLAEIKAVLQLEQMVAANRDDIATVIEFERVHGGSDVAGLDEIRLANIAFDNLQLLLDE